MMIRKYLQKLVPSTVQVFGIATALIAAMIFILGYLHQYTDAIAPFIDNIARDFYANASSELLSIVITILVLDRLNERRQNEKELARLKALLASNEAVVTKIAIAELHAKGWLKNGTLKYAHLIKGANLEKANLLSANLQGIYLDSANLNNANLSYVNLEDADLWNANLENANLWNAKLISADLKGANLENANLLSANLQNANLRDTNLQNADLRLTNLQNTKLMRANLRNIRLNKANLCGADMTSANL
ncbi:MAG: pentapeptide repeat-containing protein, partial [Aggregatilineales bacterium]